MESMDWVPGFTPPIDEYEDEDDEMTEGGEFQDENEQDGDTQDEGLGDESVEDEFFEDEMSQDEASRDVYPQDEASHDTPTPLVETGRIPSQGASDGPEERYARILNYVKSVRRTPSEASVLQFFYCWDK